MFDGGILEIYKIVPVKGERGKPVDTLEFYSREWYGEINFSLSEYYTARQANIKAVKRVRINQDRAVCSQYAVIIDGEQYNVGRVFNGIENGIAITDITLERVSAKYVVG